MLVALIPAKTFFPWNGSTQKIYSGNPNPRVNPSLKSELALEVVSHVEDEAPVINGNSLQAGRSWRTACLPGLGGAGMAVVQVVPWRRIRARWDIIDLVGLLAESSVRMSATSALGDPPLRPPFARQFSLLRFHIVGNGHSILAGVHCADQIDLPLYEPDVQA